MSNTFKSIGLIGKFADTTVANTIEALSQYLVKRKVRCIIHDDTAKLIGDQGLETGTKEDICKTCDLVIVIGGDGTMLDAARTFVDYEIPLLGINLGRLGFLVDISPDDMTKKLDNILEGDYLKEERFLLHANFICEDGVNTESYAFNEVAIHKWNVARMIELDTFINGQYVNTQRSDGMIVSTPTGSTAYALSGGGPLVHPTLDAIVMVPICPHTMSFRPIVVDGNSTIEITIADINQVDAQVTCDGRVNFNVVSGDRVVIRKKQKPICLIHPSDYDYFEILRAKLHWGHKL